jgi:hypothetical protein
MRWYEGEKDESRDELHSSLPPNVDRLRSQRPRRSAASGRKDATDGRRADEPPSGGFVVPAVPIVSTMLV